MRAADVPPPMFQMQANERSDTGAGREFEAQGGEDARTFASEAKEKFNVSGVPC